MEMSAVPRALADRLGALLSTPDAARALPIIAGFAELAGASMRHTTAGPPPAPAGVPQPVGIWHPREENGVVSFVRSAPDDEAGLWADVERIGPKNGQRRVVLIGESMARGFFYDPHFNPSLVLKQILAGTLGEAVEIVDLARVDLVAPALMTLSRRALALEPDAFVVFAGNNWHPMTMWTAQDARAVASLVASTRQWAPALDYARNALRERVRAIIRELAATSAQAGVPFVFVIPEFNLGGWSSPDPAAPALLPDAEMEQWHLLCLRARAALDSGGIAEAEECARTMLELDGGAHGASLELLAHCRMENGDAAGARALFEQARDALLAFPYMGTPRCFSVIQEVLRNEAPSLGLKIVDLPAVFAQNSESRLPPARLFHDYCHLTAEGICVAMAAAAEPLIEAFGQSVPPVCRGRAAMTHVGGEVKARAHFLSALHNSAWGQSEAVICSEIRAALDLDATMAEVLALFLDGYIRKAPFVFCRSFHQLCEGKGGFLAHYLQVSGSLHLKRHLNPDLIRAIVTSLANDSAMELLKAEHGVEQATADLLDPRYFLNSVGQLELMWLANSGLFRSSTPNSHFRFVSRAISGVRVQLAYRIPSAGSAGCVRVELNGNELVILRAGAAWASESIDLPAALLRDGFNALSIHWPPPRYNFEDVVANVSRTLDLGGIPELYAVHGEIQTLTACA